MALLVLRAILARMKPHRILFLLVLLSPFYAAAQTTTVTIAAGAPQPPQVSASYRGASGVAPIYYYVCAVFPSGSVCQFQSAIAKNTQGIAALGGNNTVTVTWTPIGGATGYYVMRFPGPTFSGSCTSCVVAALSSGTSYVDSSPSTPAGSFSVPAVRAASGQISLDNTDYPTPGLLWNLSGAAYPVALMPLGAVPGDCYSFLAVPPFVQDKPCGSGAGGIDQLTGDVTAGPGVGSQVATVVNLSHVTNASLANSGLAHPATTVNGQTCTLGSTCSITATPGGVARGDLGLNYPDPSVMGLEQVPFCSGYTPTDGEAVTYTTGLSPNPCYTAVIPSGGSITGSGTVGTIPLWTSTSTNLGDSGLTDDGTTVATAENVDTGALAVTGNGTATGTFTTGQGCTGSACISAYGFFDSGAAHEGVLTGQTTLGNWSAAIWSGLGSNDGTQFLTVNSGVLSFASPATSGTVTSVATNNGLTGGTITTTGTVGLAAISNNGALCNNSGGSAVPTSANCAVTGTGNLVLAAGPTLSGVPAAPTASPGTSTTQLATTAFVQAAVTAKTVHLAGATFSGGGTQSTQVFCCIVAANAGTIIGWDITVDDGTGSGTCASCTATVKFWKVATGTSTPTSGNSINTSGVSLSTGTSVSSATLTDFTSTAVSKGDRIAVDLSAVANAVVVNADFQYQ